MQVDKSPPWDKPMCQPGEAKLKAAEQLLTALALSLLGHDVASGSEIIDKNLIGSDNELRQLVEEATLNAQVASSI